MAILRVDELTEEGRAEVSVALEWDGEEYVGEAVGEPAASQRPLLVVVAALRAMAAIAGESADFRPADVALIDAGGVPVAMVVVEDPEAARPLVGTSVIEGDNHQIAAARAVLDAVNRRLALFL